MRSFLNQLEMAHLTHKLPWTTLAEVAPLGYKTRRHPKVREPFVAKKCHLAACLADAVAEFAATDKRSEADKEQYDVEALYSLNSFDLSLGGAGGLTEFIQFIMYGYMTLNLLAANEERVRDIIVPTWYCDIVHCHTGEWGDERLPEYFIEKAQSLLKPVRYIRPVPLQGDAEAMQRVRDYCADLFRVMYTRPDVFTSEIIFEHVERFLDD